MELPVKRKRGRPDRRFMDVVKEDMAEVEETGEDTEVRTTCDVKSSVATTEEKRGKNKNTHGDERLTLNCNDTINARLIMLLLWRLYGVTIIT